MRSGGHFNRSSADAKHTSCASSQCGDTVDSLRTALEAQWQAVLWVVTCIYAGPFESAWENAACTGGTTSIEAACEDAAITGAHHTVSIEATREGCMSTATCKAVGGAHLQAKTSWL